MSHDQDFIGQTRGITPTAPVQWRRFEGTMGVFWEAEATRSAQGYYLSNHPRISVFFNDMSPVSLSNDAKLPVTAPCGAASPTARDAGGSARTGRPMARVIFVPAGLPMWTLFTADHAFSHVDLHLRRDRLLKLLAPALGRPAALAVLGRQAESDATPAIEALARLLLEEIRAPDRHALHAESLVAGIVTGFLDLGAAPPDRAEARLSPAQMRRLVACFRAGGGRSLTVSELSSAVGLSESWFSHLFKNTTGTTPLQWQLRQRVELAQALLGGSGLSLADIAGQLGFTDQAHLTKVFRRVTGETPAAWRRAHPGGAPAALGRPQGR